MNRRSFIGALVALVATPAAVWRGVVTPSPSAKPLGLAALIAEMPQNTVVGGIDRSVYTFWRAQPPDPATAEKAHAALRVALRELKLEDNRRLYS